MIRGILIFIGLWFFFMMALSTWRSWNLKAAWSVVKTLTFAGIAATVTSIVVGLIVYIF